MFLSEQLFMQTLFESSHCLVQLGKVHEATLSRLRCCVPWFATHRRLPSGETPCWSPPNLHAPPSQINKLILSHKINLLICDGGAWRFGGLQQGVSPLGRRRWVANHGTQHRVPDNVASWTLPCWTKEWLDYKSLVAFSTLNLLGGLKTIILAFILDRSF